jgi:hypothetical protein
MAGLLDFVKTPEGQGLLSAVAGGLAGARRGAPVNSVGRGLLAGLAGYGNAQDRQAQEQERALMEQDRQQTRAMRDMQMGQMRTQLEQQQAQQAWKQGLPEVLKQSQEPTYGASDAGPTMTPPDPQKLHNYLMDPRSPYADKLLEAQFLPKASDYKTVGGSLVRIAPDGKVTEAYKAPEKVDYNQLLIPDGKGGYMVNAAYLDAKKQVAAAGKPQIDVTTKVENKATESVAKEVGPLLTNSLTAAEGATRVEDAANRVIRALESGKVITGPLASARVTGLQVADMLGIGGANDQERLIETRKAVRGLAEMTLQGRKEMAGQGAITDRESALAEKATSGDINNLTAAEIRELAAASRRAAQYTRQKHKARVKTARELPGMGTVADFYDIPEMPAEPAVAPVPTMRFNPATGKLEGVR